MKKYNKNQFDKTIDAHKKKGEISRRHFLLGAGSLVFGGALGGGLLSGCKQEVTTQTVSTTKTVSIPTTVEVPVMTTVTETAYSTVTEMTTETVTETAAEVKTVTITDAAGREITVNLPVERVAYLHPAIAESLVIVNAWDRVIAKDNYTFDTLIFPGLDNMPVLPYFESGSVDYEKIIELQPDVLLVLPTAGGIDLNEAISKLEPEIPVISVFDTNDADTWSKGIELLGAVMQREEEAQAFASFVQSIEDSVTAKTSGLVEADKPSVLLKISGWTIDQFSSFSNEFAPVKKLVDVTGAVNLAADLPSMGGWVENIDPEWLVTQDYDYVLVDIWESYYPRAMGVGVLDTSAAQTILEDLTAMNVFEGSKPVIDGHFYLMDHELIMSIRYPMLLAYAAKAFHPELFIDFDPDAVMQDYLTRFIRIEADPIESGLFFYPKL